MATTFLRHLKHNHHHCRRLLSISAAVRQDTTVWTQAPLVSVKPAAESLFHVTIDHISLRRSRIPDSTFSSGCRRLRSRQFLAIASPPSLAISKGVFQFLVKSVAGSTAEMLCGLDRGDVVELTPAMGKGFATDLISPPEDYDSSSGMIYEEASLSQWYAY